MAKNTAVIIGRFQPIHSAHIELIQTALNENDEVIILVGSVNQARTPKDPFTFKEREEMIRKSFSSNYSNKMSVVPVPNFLYNDLHWISNIQYKVDEIITDKNSIVTLYGHHKDDSSYYLDMFPQWGFKEIENINDLNSTDIREAMFEDPTYKRVEELNLPDAVDQFIYEFMNGFMHYDFLLEEYKFIKNYKKGWEKSPYPPTFITADAVVIQSGHILLIKRRASPGKGLWALPGGFVEQTETFQQGMIRELRQETSLKVPEKVLKGCIKAKEVFDAPGRSLRGRTITAAFLIDLPEFGLSKVKGSDDAEKAKWIPITEVMGMREKLFEDHYDIIVKMIGEL